MMTIPKPTIGRIVEVALKDVHRGVIVHRPAIVVVTDMGGEDGVNVQAFLDGLNDRGRFSPVVNLTGTAIDGHTMWLTSVHHNADGDIPAGAHATWRYPPRSDTQIDV